MKPVAWIAEGSENLYWDKVEALADSDGWVTPLYKGEKQMAIKGECSVELIRENEDGSADYAFNFPPEAMQALTRLGILTAIKAGIEDAKRLNPEEYDDRQDKR